MPKLLAEEHPELVHYTNAAGLLGIIQSQTLRATHYAYLNDAVEVKHFLEARLPEILKVTVSDHLEEAVKQDKDIQTLIDADGGIESIIGRVVKEIPAKMVSRLLNGQNGEAPIAEPHFTSFCTAKGRYNRVNEHGLLSQWRGYGANGGYAIVFDTAGLSRLLEEVGKKWENGTDLFAGDVIYSSDPDEKFFLEFEEDVAVIRDFFLDQFKSLENPRNLEKIYLAFMKCACRYKHWGFKEENEVRIVVIPNNKMFCEILRTGGHNVVEVPRKHYLRNNTLVPYIELFEGVTLPHKKSLPIKRIIVGPAPNDQEKTRRIRAAELLIEQHGLKADVVVSEIPYLG